MKNLFKASSVAIISLVFTFLFFFPVEGKESGDNRTIIGLEKLNNLEWKPRDTPKLAYYLGDSYPVNPFLDGKVYLYDSKKCFRIKRSPESIKQGNQMLTEIKCDDTFVKMATEPYKKIDNIKDFFIELKKCIDNKSMDCLRPLVYRNVDIGSNIYPGETRDLILYLSSGDIFKTLKQVVDKYPGNYELDSTSAIPKLGHCSGEPTFMPREFGEEILLMSWFSECEGEE